MHLFAILVIPVVLVLASAACSGFCLPVLTWPNPWVTGFIALKLSTVVHVVGVPMHVFVLVIYVVPAALFFAIAACFVFSR